VKRKSGPSFPLLLVGGALAALAGGTLLYGCRDSGGSGGDTSAPTTVQAAAPTPSGGILPEPAPQPTADTGSKSASAEPRTVTVYRVETDNDGSHLKSAPVRVTATTDDAPVAALNAMARFGKDSPLPSGAEARSVKIDGDTATVDFNQAFVKNFTGGDENEALVINAVTAVLGQFSGVKQVQVTVEGKKIDSLGGTQTLDTPLPVPQTVDAPQQTAQSSGDGDH
jgi:spore germination protein GerM